MLRELGIPRWLLLYGGVVPLAIFIGYLLATPLDFTSYVMVGLILFVLSIPMMLKHHYAWLVFGWNSWIVIYFFPGQPSLGVFMAFASLSLSILYRIMNKRASFIRVPSVAAPIIFLGVLVLITAYFTGGLAGQAFGGGDVWGAKRYLGVFGSIVAYFALTAQAIPREKAYFYGGLFLLSGLTAVASDIIYALGPAFYFLFIFFPSTVAYLQATTQETLMRLTGLSFAALSVYNWMLMRFSIGGLFNLRKPWRLVLFFVVGAVALLGGFRAIVIVMLMVFFVQFYLEGLIRSRLFPVLIMFLMLMAAGVVGFIEKMPLSVQRSLSFIPGLEVNYLAEHDAFSSADWRLQMWKALLPDVPKYLWLGKGFAFSATDYHLTGEAVKRGYFSTFEDTLIAGNYHHGILTLIIPFGIFGVLGFLWFGVASARVLHRNYRYGDPALRHLNTFLYGYFVARFIFYVVLYGQFDLDFGMFTGTIAFSLAVNRGVRGPEDLQETIAETVAEPEPALA